MLNKNQTKDGPVSANPDQFKEIIKLSKMSEQDLKEYLKEMGVDIKKSFWFIFKINIETELLNRDYLSRKGLSFKDKNNKIFFLLN